MSSVIILFLLPHCSVLRAVFELMLHNLKSWLSLSVEKKPSLLFLPLTLDGASFPFLCSKYPSGSEPQIG